MMTVPFIEELETIGLMIEDAGPRRPVAEVPVVTLSLVDEVAEVKGAPVEFLVAEPVVMAIPLDKSVDDTAEDGLFEKEMLIVVAVDGRSVEGLERETPLA